MTTRTCPECGADFDTNHAGKVFCTEACRIAYANLSLSRGKSITPLAITWRRHRNSEIGKQALAELCRILSGYIAEDRDEDRECAIQIEALLNGFHVKKHDRVGADTKRRAARANLRQRAEPTAIAA